MKSPKEKAIEILESRGLFGKGSLPAIHTHHNDARADAETERDNAEDEDEAQEADNRALDHEDKADRAKQLMKRIAQRRGMGK